MFGTSHMLFHLFLRIQNIITPLLVVGRESLGCLVPDAPLFIMDDYPNITREKLRISSLQDLHGKMIYIR
ncbi:hypothetical protein BFO01nite_19710 [Brevibacillus formosus]|uniref:Uncharacterized protein n=1 Tax=Brevibacillus formosus TaxID=54913 RepID=A0ABQ0T6N9_9BACL|nr:hypothetical protein BFO01nite_19710 [Brevibacillus formosus]